MFHRSWKINYLIIPHFLSPPSDFCAHQRHTKCARNDTWQHKKCHTKAARLVNIGYFIINTNCGWLNFHRGVLSCQRQTSYLAYLPTYTLAHTHPHYPRPCPEDVGKQKYFVTENRWFIFHDGHKGRSRCDAILYLSDGEFAWRLTSASTSERRKECKNKNCTFVANAKPNITWYPLIGTQG